MSALENIVLRAGVSVSDAIRAIDRSGLQAVIIIGEDGRLRGMVTDGDVRRAILRGISLEGPVDLIMNTAPRVMVGPVSREAALARLRELDVSHLPILDHERRLIGLETLREHIGVEDDSCWAVVMAGGLGKRLAPLTHVIPKPLLPVMSRPILEHIIESLVSHGLKRIFLSVNYKADMIKEHCGDGSKWGARISYLEETTPRGTAGALALLPGRPKSDLLVMNGDILTGLNFRALVDFHRKQGNPATMCVREQRNQIQFGVVQFDGPYVSRIVEKPYYSFFINAGIYVLDRSTLDLVPREGFFDMPTLFENLVNAGNRPGVFPLRESWLDIGSINDLRRAQKLSAEPVKPAGHDPSNTAAAMSLSFTAAADKVPSAGRLRVVPKTLRPTGKT